MSLNTKNATEEKSMQLAESSREEWEKTSFFKELFMGNFSFKLIDPFPKKKGGEGIEFQTFLKNYEIFLKDEVDADQIDREGKIPPNIINRLKEMKLFALKIDKHYGGLGFTQSEYNEILKLTASVDANLSALLSAHQSIGVPQPLILFGTPAQKEKYLTRIADGQISAFALTESNVGSDPANLETTVTEEKDYYVLNGKKLWCTNVLIADVIVVMARHPENDTISAFIVEMNWEGVSILHRCHFMGLHALENGVVAFHNVKIPKENLIGERGKGLKVALVTLNTGRLALPASIVGITKKTLEIARVWSRVRIQWGKPIGEHEAIAHMMSDISANTFAIETVAELATALYDNHQDIRLEAAVAKLYCTEVGWQNIDQLMQIRGGRGFETADSLRARGEANIPVERLMRDFRINRIFEGTTEIMHLFIAREAVDKHLKISGVLLDKKATLGKKMAALPKIALFYSWWYLKLWCPFHSLKYLSGYGSFGEHLRFIERSTRKLAREIFHGMIVYGPKLQNKQAFLFRLVDIAVELFVMAAVIAKVRTFKDNEKEEAKELISVHCRHARFEIAKKFQSLWHNCDEEKYRMARRIENNELTWLEEGIIKLTPLQKEKIAKI